MHHDTHPLTFPLPSLPATADCPAASLTAHIRLPWHYAGVDRIELEPFKAWVEELVIAINGKNGSMRPEHALEHAILACFRPWLAQHEAEVAEEIEQSEQRKAHAAMIRSRVDRDRNEEMERAYAEREQRWLMEESKLGRT